MAASADDAENSIQSLTETRRSFTPPKGVSRNPKGTSSTHQRLTQKTLRLVYQDFRKYGRKAIERCREEHPDVYLRVVVSMLPKDISVHVDGTLEHKHEAVGAPTDWIEAVVVGCDPSPETDKSEG